MATSNLSYKFKTADVVTKLIVINAVVFLLLRFIGFALGLKEDELIQLTSWFVLPDDPSEFLLQPWAFVTYAFLHFGFFHILFNMLWLYWFGQFILNIFTEKRFLTVYLLGAIFGGLTYVLAYNLFPTFLGARSYLIGASGAVTAIMVFIATYTPNAQIRFFTFNIKLWHIAVFLVLLDVVRLPVSDNAGGLMAHLGGAAFGYIYASQLLKGNDIGIWFEKIMDWIANLFKTRKQKPFKKVHRTQTKSASRKSKNVTEDDKTSHQRKIDTILDKIGKSGYDSLTKDEKDFLFRAGKED